MQPVQVGREAVRVRRKMQVLGSVIGCVESVVQMVGEEVVKGMALEAAEVLRRKAQHGCWVVVVAVVVVLVVLMGMLDLLLVWQLELQDLVRRLLGVVMTEGQEVGNGWGRS